MSERKCGCVYSDARNNSWVRAGKEMSGSIMQRCAQHQAEWDAALASALVEPTLEQKLARADARIAELEAALRGVVAQFDAPMKSGGAADLLRAVDAAHGALANIDAARAGNGESGDA